MMSPARRTDRGRAPRRAFMLAVLVAATALVPAGASARRDGAVSAVKQLVAAQLVQCLTTGPQSERAATFAGEMQALPGAAKLQMRIDVLERLPGELTYHAVVDPGLGVWRTAAPGVKSYRYLKEVSNLTAPAAYRAVVRFRWLNAKGRLMKSLEMRTPRCLQPAPKGEEGAPPGAAS